MKGEDARKETQVKIKNHNRIISPKVSTSIKPSGIVYRELTRKG
jgi:hypothetical protein